MDKVNEIGENTFLKLRQQRDQARAECDQAKIQRDVALRKLNKALDVIKEQRKYTKAEFIIENSYYVKSFMVNVKFDPFLYID